MVRMKEAKPGREHSNRWEDEGKVMSYAHLIWLSKGRRFIGEERNLINGVKEK